MQIHTEKQIFTAYTKPQNHRVVWDGRDIQDLLVPTPMPWAGSPSSRPGSQSPV